MYYICKFSDSWSLFDVKANKSHILEKNEIDCLNKLFPALLKDNGKMLLALQISNIQPNKLVNLPGPQQNGSVKKDEALAKT